MEALFKDGEVLKVAIGWLEGTTQLRMANGALFIANLARSGKYILYTLYIYTPIKYSVQKPVLGLSLMMGDFPQIQIASHWYRVV